MWALRLAEFADMFVDMHHRRRTVGLAQQALWLAKKSTQHGAHGPELWILHGRKPESGRSEKACLRKV
jgi:hypothetical protein